MEVFMNKGAHLLWKEDFFMKLNLKKLHKICCRFMPESYYEGNSRIEIMNYVEIIIPYLGDIHKSYNIRKMFLILQ
jgi:hypothetical protein